MAQLSISEVARQVGLRPSAIRYYERAKVLMPARRVSGQRRYDVAAVYQLAVLRRAQETGFTLDEIRELFTGFGESTPISARWKEIAKNKLVELDARMEEIRTMKELLERLQSRCRCDTVGQCGEGILRSAPEWTAAGKSK
jgi:MerR family transcriptional regulator, redox-sensitive transcriptional activator SoxR